MAKKKAKDGALEPSASGSDLDPVRIRRAIETLYAAQAAYVDEVAQVRVSGMMPQRLIAMAHAAGQAQRVMSDIQSAFYERVNAMRTKGRFERGEFGVDFKLLVGRRSPQWKDEATLQARAVAELRGKKFNPGKYHKRVLDRAPKGEDRYSAEIIVREEA